MELKIKNIIKLFLKRIGVKWKTKVFFTKHVFKDKKFVIGDYTYGVPQVIFENENANLIIGKYCSISEQVTIFLGGNHRLDWITTYPFTALPNYFPSASKISGHPSTNGNVTIGNDVWIGRGVTIMSGVTIEHGSVLAAYSVITKDVGPYEIWGGNPAKLIRTRFSEEKVSFLLELKWWDWPEEKILNNIHFLCGDENNLKNVKN
jgi:acetyltransferase-like isoleucine patch superfamily enzyme